MTAAPLLTLAARSLARHRLDAVLIGNAAAALQGSPVTTLDLDFMFRKTPGNLAKLKRIAAELDAMLLTPFYPASGLYRLTRDRDGVQFDFMSRVHGIRSFERLRSRALMVRFGRHALLVAHLEDVIRSKRAADGPRIARSSPCCRGHSMPKPRSKKSRVRSALRRESDRALGEQIRRLLALPPEKRTNFLRKRVPGGSAM
jgi:hypothetical protein